MEYQELKDLWREYNKKLENSLSLNHNSFENVIKQNAKSTLKAVMPVKIIGIIFGILWVLFVDRLILNYFSLPNIFFIVSAGIHVIVTKIAIGVYIYHLVLAKQIDSSHTVLEVQEKLTYYKKSTFLIIRILFLQLPVFTTFYLNVSMFQNPNIVLWVLQIFITLIFTALGIWLFFNLKPENIDKKWFRLIFRGTEWNSLITAIELSNQINEYKKAEPVQEDKVNS
jgi:hypothetical protein